MGLVGPRWSPCWSHEPCYQGLHSSSVIDEDNFEQGRNFTSFKKCHPWWIYMYRHFYDTMVDSHAWPRAGIILVKNLHGRKWEHLIPYLFVGHFSFFVSIINLMQFTTLVVTATLLRETYPIQLGKVCIFPSWATCPLPTMLIKRWWNDQSMTFHTQPPFHTIPTHGITVTLMQIHGSSSIEWPHKRACDQFLIPYRIWETSIRHILMTRPDLM